MGKTDLFGYYDWKHVIFHSYVELTDHVLMDELDENINSINVSPIFVTFLTLLRIFSDCDNMWPAAKTQDPGVWHKNGVKMVTKWPLLKKKQPSPSPVVCPCHLKDHFLLEIEGRFGTQEKRVSKKKCFYDSFCVRKLWFMIVFTLHFTTYWVM